MLERGIFLRKHWSPDGKMFLFFLILEFFLNFPLKGLLRLIFRIALEAIFRNFRPMGGVLRLVGAIRPLICLESIGVRVVKLFFFQFFV